MTDFCLVDFAGYERYGYILGAKMPPDSLAYSPHIDLGYTHQSTPWRDELPHYHASSEEFFVVLKGQLDVQVRERVVPVRAGQLMGIRAGVAHQMVGVHPPVENFLLRVPGGGMDKVLVPDGQSMAGMPGDGRGDIFQLEIHQNFSDYPVGACLPVEHVNYSPELDFTCAWGVDPVAAWRNDQWHYHTLREEYFIVLRGRLDFQIGSQQVIVRAGQVIAIRPETTHKVIGGAGPADVLFVRVPGGRGDKVVVE